MRVYDGFACSFPELGSSGLFGFHTLTRNLLSCLIMGISHHRSLLFLEDLPSHFRWWFNFVLLVVWRQAATFRVLVDWMDHTPPLSFSLHWDCCGHCYWVDGVIIVIPYSYLFLPVIFIFSGSACTQQSITIFLFYVPPCPVREYLALCANFKLICNQPRSHPSPDLDWGLWECFSVTI